MGTQIGMYLHGRIFSSLSRALWKSVFVCLYMCRRLYVWLLLRMHLSRGWLYVTHLYEGTALCSPWAGVAMDRHICVSIHRHMTTYRSTYFQRRRDIVYIYLCLDFRSPLFNLHVYLSSLYLFIQRNRVQQRTTASPKVRVRRKEFFNSLVPKRDSLCVVFSLHPHPPPLFFVFAYLSLRLWREIEKEMKS